MSLKHMMFDYIMKGNLENSKNIIFFSISPQSTGNAIT